MSVIPHDVIKDSMTEREYQFKRKKVFFSLIKDSQKHCNILSLMIIIIQFIKLKFETWSVIIAQLLQCRTSGSFQSVFALMKSWVLRKEEESASLQGTYLDVLLSTCMVFCIILILSQNVISFILKVQKVSKSLTGLLCSQVKHLHRICT